MTVLVVDVANVMGSRPDGWWRDRAGAATRLMASLVPLVGAQTTDPAASTVPGAAAGDRAGAGDPDGARDQGDASLRIDRIVAVVEGKARAATAPDAVEVVPAPADGDSTIVEVAREVIAAGEVPLVITADRGLRERLPPGSRFTGPTWLLALL